MEINDGKQISMWPEFRTGWQWWSLFVLGLIGLLDALYLTYVKLDQSTAAFCAPGGGCDVVNNSPYAEVYGIPVALLGALAYLALLGLLVLERTVPGRMYVILLAGFGLSLAGFLYSAYLTYVEIAIIGAICPYCVISAVVITVYFAIATVRLLRYEA